MSGRAGDFGWAVGILLGLGVLWTAADDTLDAAERGDRDLEARVLLLMERYDNPDGGPLPLPTLMVADWDGPGVAAASCDRWRIRVRPGAVASLSDGALDELLAHELAHLLACSETGRRTVHDSDWWRVYRQIMAIG